MALRPIYTLGERTAAGVGLAIAVTGLLNLWIWKTTLAGLDTKQIAIISFLPAALITYYVLNRARPGATNE